MTTNGTAPVTDWPLVETDRRSWEEWAKAAPPAGAESVRVVLLGEPQGKGRPRARIVKPKCKKCRGVGCRFCKGTGRGPDFVSIYTPRETEKYEEALALAGRAAMKRRGPLTGPLRIGLLVVMPVPASWSGKRKVDALHGSIRPCVSPDWDNVGKMTDALNGICWEDDKQVVSANVEKVYGQLPRLEIDIIPIKAAGLFST